MNTNKITRAIIQLIGDKTPDGYALPTNNGLVPIRLNKDYKAEYPEIRISPFLSKRNALFQKYIDADYTKYRKWQSGMFQIDIYCTTLIECQNIYDIIETRLDDFFNLETLIYDYSPFEDDGDNVYKNASYALLDDDLFKDIYGITVEKYPLKRVRSLDKLVNDSYYVDSNYLYVKTKKNLKTIKIKVLLQGRLFQDGQSFSDKGLHHYFLSKQRNLSNLEANEVERISFDLNVLFSQKRERERLPKVNRIIHPKIKKSVR